MGHACLKACCCAAPRARCRATRHVKRYITSDNRNTGVPPAPALQPAAHGSRTAHGHAMCTARPGPAMLTRPGPSPVPTRPPGVRGPPPARPPPPCSPTATPTTALSISYRIHAGWTLAMHHADASYTARTRYTAAAYRLMPVAVRIARAYSCVPPSGAVAPLTDAQRPPALIRSESGVGAWPRASALRLRCHAMPHAPALCALPRLCVPFSLLSAQSAVRTG